ncbi:MAG: glutathione S-transferase family protein [SAR324 cluster bacterium]|nr:glutathione S-transferase family protein [SAR324 cluster bacterium]MCZ6728893.1 glutathione S-transferase family protein [SAR324 cluster bacterium]MCZ6842427.1 glutathione S-transferase family protein [SAR324 cluster bacterium]
MITIYGIHSSRTRRCLWMLEELGLPYKQIQVDHRQEENLTEEYRAINPNMRIPTLVDGELVLWESMAINHYLADKYDGGLRPKNEEDRARAYQWSFWGMAEADSLLNTIIWHRHIFPEEHRKPERADKAEAAMQKPFSVLNESLEDRTYLLGDVFTVADLNLSFMFAWARSGQADLSAFPNINRWLDACLSRPKLVELQAVGGTYPKPYKTYPD